MTDPGARFSVGDHVTWVSYDAMGHFKRRIGYIWNFQPRMRQSGQQEYVYHVHDNKTGTWYHPIHEDQLSPVSILDQLVEAMDQSDGN